VLLDGVQPYAAKVMQLGEDPRAHEAFLRVSGWLPPALAWLQSAGCILVASVQCSTALLKCGGLISSREQDQLQSRNNRPTSGGPLLSFRRAHQLRFCSNIPQEQGYAALMALGGQEI
jgi:hypothetical protein